MDAHVFRRFGQALAAQLMGARLEKIQSPADQIYVFSIYTQKSKKHLILKSSRRNPFIYFAKTRPTADAPPKANIMRMRKYCAGRRIVSCSLDWINRKILLLFCTKSDHNENVETWLVLDLRHGPSLVLGKCPTLPLEDDKLIWPNQEQALEKDWQNWPMLTPSLRRVLPYLDVPEQEALLIDLETGGGDIFVYGQGNEAELLAWPLPNELALGRHGQIFEDPFMATSLVGDALVLQVAAQSIRDTKAIPHKREIIRLQRLLEKLKTEEVRLQELVALHNNGLALQNAMWQYDAQAKVDTIDIPNYGLLQLDSRLSISDNMQSFFHKAGRGRRGLQFLKTRREQLKNQLQVLNKSLGVMLSTAIEASPNTHAKNSKPLNLPKGIELLYSQDGFVILRGKDAKGNWAALRMAQAHDLWLHVEGGPGAHCIIRRQYTGQEIPQTTLLEAARYAATKSWQKDSPQAQIISAEVRYVKPMRNAAAGTVRIDKVFKSFRVDVQGQN